MSKIINIEENNSVLIISTEGYLNKDLATSIFDESSKYIDEGTRTVLILSLIHISEPTRPY